MFVLSFVFWYVCSRLFLFSFSLAFCFTKIVRETLCRFLYVYASLKCMFMQYIMINRYVLEFLQVFRTFVTNVLSFYFSVSRFSFLWEISRKRKQKKKSRIFRRFCHKTSLFVANKTLIFSVLWIYRTNYTPPPVFGTRRVGQLSSEIFYFLFFIFL